jgi:enoyl-CoA hydratase/carnithine racemase
MAAATVDLGSRHLHATRADGVLRVVIDRPERRNALTIEMYHGLKKAAVLAERDADVDVLLVTAAGRWFCVGGEMGGRHEGGPGLDRETDGIDLLPFVQFERCPKIVVMGINGMCQGGGLNMTLTSDLAVASERATFRAPELLRGVADCFLGARLASRIGIARAKALLFTAREIPADEALAMGLVSRVVPHEQLEAVVAETIEQVRQTGPQARTALKRDLNRQLPSIDFPMFTASLASEEVREGFAAFVEKRPPRWTRREGKTSG